MCVRVEIYGALNYGVARMPIFCNNDSVVIGGSISVFPKSFEIYAYFSMFLILYIVFNKMIMATDDQVDFFNAVLLSELYLILVSKKQFFFCMKRTTIH